MIALFKPLFSLWQQERARSILQQLLFIAVVGVVFWFMASNARSRVSGFGFFSDAYEGAPLSFQLLKHTTGMTNLRTVGVAFANTLFVSILTIFFATILGFTIGLMRLSQNWLSRQISTIYVEVIRNIPLLLQIFFWFKGVMVLLPGPREKYKDVLGESLPYGLDAKGFTVPQLIFNSNFSYTLGAFFIGLIAALGVQVWAKKRQVRTGKTFQSFRVSLLLILGLPLLSFILSLLLFKQNPTELVLPVAGRFGLRGGITVPPGFFALLLGLTIYSAAYIAEYVRSGVQSVSKGQREAAASLGLRHSPIMRWVVIPQALRVIIPQLTNQYINIFKNSSLAAFIGYPDFLYVMFKPILEKEGTIIEISLVVALVYLSISVLTSVIMNVYNRMSTISER